MVTSITNPTNRNVLPLLSAYKYDQLNRIKAMQAFDDIDLDNNKWHNTAWTDKYKNTFDYDANGNIDTLRRYDANQNIFDNFTYNYLKDGTGNLMQNRLYHINDTCAANKLAVDIDDQGVFDDTVGTINRHNNYSYDEIGNLKRDSSEGIANIEWTVYGKVKKITRRTGFNKTVNSTLIYPSDLEFLYDPTGNRIAKIEKPRDAGGVKSAAEWKTTYYVRDAQGNTMATYKLQPDTINNIPATSFMLKEFDMYGSSRLGIKYDTIELIAAISQTNVFTHTLGNKQYEITNHLSNVMSTVSDRKIQIDADNDSIVDYYIADIKSSSDYLPFGMLAPGRNFSSDQYRHLFNGKENDDEWNGTTDGLQDYGMRMYDTRACKFISVDPLNRKYSMLSTYQFAGNNPIKFIDLDGGEPGLAHLESIYILHGQGKISDEALAAYENVNNTLAPYTLTIAATVLTFGAAAEVGVAVSLTTVAYMGTGGAIVNGATAAFMGENAYEVSNAMITGFVAGAVLGMTIPYSSFVASSFISGVVESYADQLISGKDIDLVKMVTDGGITAATAYFTESLKTSIKDYVGKEMDAFVGKTKSKDFIAEMKAKIQTDHPDKYKGVGLDKEADRLIKKQIEVYKKIGSKLIKAANKAVDKSEEAIKKKVQTEYNNSIGK